ncbi:hypothetical protein AOA59_24850, partial [Pseudomonas sp. 2822-15]
IRELICITGTLFVCNRCFRFFFICVLILVFHNYFFDNRRIILFFTFIWEYFNDDVSHYFIWICYIFWQYQCTIESIFTSFIFIIRWVVAIPYDTDSSLT